MHKRLKKFKKLIAKNFQKLGQLLPKHHRLSDIDKEIKKHDENSINMDQLDYIEWSYDKINENPANMSLTRESFIKEINSQEDKFQSSIYCLDIRSSTPRVNRKLDLEWNDEAVLDRTTQIHLDSTSFFEATFNDSSCSNISDDLIILTTVQVPAY